MKIVQSLVFRIAILGVSIGLINTQPNTFSIGIYYALIFLYLTVYIILRKFDYSLLRLFWDFLFINFIVYEKDVHNPLAYFLLIMPLVNAINFTGKKKHYFILLFLTLVTFYVHSGGVGTYYLIPCGCLLVMYLLSVFNYSILQSEKEISDRVDSFYLSPDKIKSYQIYEGLVGDLNKLLNFKMPTGIKRLRVYTIRYNKLWLVNSSEFIWERMVGINEKMLSDLRHKHYCWSSSRSEMAYYHYISKEELEYVFVCDINSDADISLYRLRFSFIYNKMLDKVFNKVSMLLNTEYKIKLKREANFNEIKDTVIYVNQAVRVMHFIRNKMTPFSNLIAYHKNEASFSDEMREKMNAEFSKEVDQAGRDLKDILIYANDLLDSNNPFSVSEIIEISIQKLYIVLSELVENHFNTTVINSINLDSEVLQTRVIHSNLIQCKILITDWIENMRKYANNHKSISVRMDGNSFIIHFENNYTRNEDDIMTLVRDMNSLKKDAVLEGKNYGHGIHIIKSIARDLGITISAKKDYRVDVGSLLSFDIIFETYEKEDSSF